MSILNDLSGMFYRCAYDEDWTMTFVTDGCQKLTGYEPEEILHNKLISYGKIIHPDDAPGIYERFSQALEEKRIHIDHYRIMHKSGQVRTVWEKASGIYDEDGNVKYLEGYITDITDLMEKEEISNELHSEKQKHAQKDKLYIRVLEKTLFMISHEVRKPVTNCLGIMHLMKTDGSLSREEAAELLKHFETSMHELDVCTRTLTDFVHEHRIDKH